MYSPKSSRTECTLSELPAWSYSPIYSDITKTIVITVSKMIYSIIKASESLYIEYKYISSREDNVNNIQQTLFAKKKNKKNPKNKNYMG